MNNRLKKVLEIYQKGYLLNLKNINYKNRIINFFSSSLIYDIGKEDLTSISIINNSIEIEAEIISKEAGIIAGLKEIEFYYQLHGILAELLCERWKRNFCRSKINEIKRKCSKNPFFRKSWLKYFKKNEWSCKRYK